MSGYGFGVWLVPKNKNIEKHILHTPHITIMCNMETENDALSLFENIKKEMGERDFLLKIIGRCELFGNTYEMSDPLKAVGYYCESNDWNEFERICNNHIGDFSKRAHMSHSYSMSILSLVLRHIKDINVECELKVVDIRGLFPAKWKILN